MKDITFDDESRRKEQNEKKLGEEIRQQALETYSETLSRKSDDDVPNKKRRRTSGNETVSFLREHMASGEVIREKELELKQLELGQAQKA